MSKKGGAGMTCPWPSVWTSLETMKGTMKDLSFALPLASIVFMGCAPPHSTRDTVGDCIRNCRHEHLIVPVQLLPPRVGVIVQRVRPYAMGNLKSVRIAVFNGKMPWKTSAEVL